MTAAPIVVATVDAARVHTLPAPAGELTPLERRVALAASPSFGVDLTAPEFRSIVRDHMRETAYHEAGHVAARAFTRLEFSHIISASIIPDGDSGGCVRARGAIAETFLGGRDPALAWRDGHTVLLDVLAGRGVEARLTGADAGYILGDEEAELRGTDLWRANRVARIMSRPGWSGFRVLEMVAQWTHEMLQIPAVWACVEKVAGLLLERGTIEDRDLLLGIMGDVPFAARIPKWRRRLVPSNAVMRALYPGWPSGPDPAELMEVS